MKKHYNLNVTEDNGESVTTSNTSTEHASEILRIMALAGIKPEAIEEHGEAEMEHTPANDELDLDDYSKKSPESIAKQKKSIQPSHGDNPLEYSLDENEIFESLMTEFKSEMLEEGTCPECGGKKHKLMACSSCGCSESIEEEVVNELNVPNDKEKVKAQIQKLHKMADDARANGDSNKAYNIERSSEMAALHKKLSKLGGDIDDANWITPEGGPLSYKKVGEYTYIVKDENGEEHKAEMGAMGDEQDNYSPEEIEQTMDQEGLEMLIRQAKMGAPAEAVEEAPMDDEMPEELTYMKKLAGL